MITDYDFALIELDAAETARYADDEQFRAEVRKAACDLSRRRDWTVLIYGADGCFLDTVAA